jgi:hypothetical protein
LKIFPVATGVNGVRGLGETDSGTKPEVENLVALSFLANKNVQVGCIPRNVAIAIQQKRLSEFRVLQFFMGKRGCWLTPESEQSIVRMTSPLTA